MVRNNWEPTDVEAMKLFAAQRESSTIPISDRALARAIGVSAPRVSDLFNFRHGTPTLREFIALCAVFKLSPSSAIDAAINNAAKNTESGDTNDPPEVGERLSDSFIDDIAAHPEQYGIAANRDENKTLEAETPRD